MEFLVGLELGVDDRGRGILPRKQSTPFTIVHLEDDDNSDEHCRCYI
jgi:hypothetical protein